MKNATLNPPPSATKWESCTFPFKWKFSGGVQGDWFAKGITCFYKQKSEKVIYFFFFKIPLFFGKIWLFFPQTQEQNLVWKCKSIFIIRHRFWKTIMLVIMYIDLLLWMSYIGSMEGRGIVLLLIAQACRNWAFVNPNAHQYH